MARSSGGGGSKTRERRGASVDLIHNCVTLKLLWWFRVLQTTLVVKSVANYSGDLECCKLLWERFAPPPLYAIILHRHFLLFTWFGLFCFINFPDGMPYCRSDWTGLCLLCCYQSSCVSSIFQVYSPPYVNIFHGNFLLFTSPPRYTSGQVTVCNGEVELPLSPYPGGRPIPTSLSSIMIIRIIIGEP